MEENRSGQQTSQHILSGTAAASRCPSPKAHQGRSKSCPMDIYHSRAVCSTCRGCFISQEFFSNNQGAVASPRGFKHGSITQGL